MRLDGQGKALAALPREGLTRRRVAHFGPTGGTTGLPKVAPRTHNELLCCAEYANLAWGTRAPRHLSYRRTDRT